MSTLRVDNIKSRTSTTVTIPESHSLSVSGGLNITGVTTYAAGSTLDLAGTNINAGTRGDVLYYDSSGQIAKLNLGAAGAVLKSDGSDVVWGNIGGATNVYYVATNGVDASGRGGSIDTAYKTIKYACSNIGTPTATSPAVIFVKAGLYEETQLPIIVPAFTTIVGDNLRATIVKPGAGLDSSGSVLNTRSTLFRLSNGTIVQDMVLDGMGGYTPGSPDYKPESATIGGVYFGLNAASVVATKSPYIYNVTSFGNGATGALVDGALHASGNRSMLFHTYTAIHSDGLGVWCKANSNAEMISTFSYYCQIGFSATGGSKIRSLNSSNAYGEYGVYSAGFDATETANQGSVKGTMLSYANVLTADFTLGEQITGGTSGATAYVANVQAEPKRIYIVGKSGTFASNEVVTGGGSGTTATLVAGTVEGNQTGRILVTAFTTVPDAGDALQFATTDGNAFQIQSVSSVTANSVTYRVLVFSTSRATPVAQNVALNVRKEFSTVRLTGHDFLQVGTGGTDTTNWPNNPTQAPSQADQVIVNATDPGRVYYTATDELGNFYVGDQFKVDQATGNVTLDASAFNLAGLESLRLGSVGGLIGASVDEFSTDVNLTQNSNTKVPTQAAVKGYVDTVNDITPTGGTLGVVGILTANSAVFSGNLSVGGALTYEDVTNVDSIGIITARSGVDVDDFISVGSNIHFGNAGIATVTTLNATTITATNFGTVTATKLVTNEIVEKVVIDSTALNGTRNIDLANNAVYNFTTNTTGNFTFNFRGDGSNSLNSLLSTGDSMTVALLCKQGGSAYYNNGYQVDGSSVTPLWSGGTAPSSGNANSTDIYTFTIIKIGNASWTVLATQTKYA